MNRLPSGLGISVVADISEQKKREEQWRIDLERVQLIEDILDNLPFPVLVKDRNLAYAAVNKAACTMVETSAESILGRTVSTCIRAGRRPDRRCRSHGAGQRHAEHPSRKGEAREW